MNAEVRIELTHEHSPQIGALPVEAARDRILQICLDNLQDPDFSTVRWAEIVGISDRHLRRRVRKLTGTGSLEWLREQRLLKAKALFERGAVTNLGEAGRLAGFPKTNYFYRLYRARFTSQTN